MVVGGRYSMSFFRENRRLYSLSEILVLALNFLYTRLRLPVARLVRFPLDLRGRSGMCIGRGFTSGYGCRLEAYGKQGETVLWIGRNVQINDYVHIAASERVSIGENVLIASRVFITDISHGSYAGYATDSSPLVPPAARLLATKPVTIEENVWIGENVSILPGVHIGKGCIVGANSVVTKSIAADCIVGGIPARVLKKYDSVLGMWMRLD